MRIILCVTSNTCLRRALILLVTVAGLALGDLMSAEQWKCRAIVIDDHPGPGIGDVAARAVRTQLPAMRILVRMAGHATHVELFPVRIVLVAALATQGTMPARQRKPRQLRMIEADLFPGCCVVAGMAFGAVASLVGILVAVAIDAGAGDAAEQLRPLVATETRGLAVFAEQREPCPGMIETLRGLPSARLMAALAIVAQGSRMRILRSMACHAFGRCAAEHVGLTVTSRALGERMTSE